MDLHEQLGLSPATFDGRVAVVTGAARGIGEQVAWGLAKLGAHVVLLDVLEEGENAAAKIRGNDRSAEFFKADLRDLQALELFQRYMYDAHGGVDILVNNASRLRFTHFQDAAIDDWDDLHATTVRASAFLTQKFLPRMISQKHGVICNTMGANALSQAAYFAAAMAGQKSMILSLAGELGDDSGVSVLGFAPGNVDTPMVRALTPHFPRFFGMLHEEFIERVVRNPGYHGPGFDGLMPAEHCGASYVYCLANAKAYHGQIADAFHPLIEHDVICCHDEPETSDHHREDLPRSVWQVYDYLHGHAEVNRNLEVRILEKTKKLEDANRSLQEQKQRFEDVSEKVSKYLPRQVYQSIFSGHINAEITSRRKHLTIFFSDIRGFTNKAERLEPEAMTSILNLYFSEMADIAEAFGATIDKFIGDAIVAFFGDPDTQGHEEDAYRCVAMAVEMRRRMASLQSAFARFGLLEPLETRVGINSGYCTVGNFGSRDRLEYTIIGTPVNIAARLQEACDPNAILISKSTRVLLGDRLGLQQGATLKLKGIAGEIETFEIMHDQLEASDSRQGQSEQLTSIEGHLARLDLEKLGAAERAALLATLSKLSKD
jgi:class 3 adenylate cyclase/NAD(P)-dependent dehydrogenase (short-subunit alcohol dehydrogenase family)